ncbi:conserved protein of unknown function [Tenacibaculum sp. 190130A14a]|uniref:Secreted protein n=1 Tax=Tenacibaculum polynesiense TaxID=3137857 RepID=A0ABM9P6P6_9FLAO
MNRIIPSIILITTSLLLFNCSDNSVDEMLQLKSNQSLSQTEPGDDGKIKTTDPADDGEKLSSNKIDPIKDCPENDRNCNGVPDDQERN